MCAKRIQVKLLYITILYCLYSLFSMPLKAQCYFPLEFEIVDQATVTIPFDIIGAVNNDLSSPSQCVAEVSIDFEHSVIGDLLINLISPAGQVVNLIGPVGPPDLLNLSHGIYRLCLAQQHLYHIHY